MFILQEKRPWLPHMCYEISWKQNKRNRKETCWISTEGKLMATLLGHSVGGLTKRCHVDENKNSKRTKQNHNMETNDDMETIHMSK